MRTRKAWTAVVVTVAVTLLSVVTPLHGAWSQRQTVIDVEETIPAAVEIASVDFNYGKKRITMRAQFTQLSQYVEYYRFDLRGPHGHRWSLGWAHESLEWNDRKRVKWIYLYDPEFRHLKCRVRWDEDLASKVVEATFASTCLRVNGKPARWLRMQFSADDVYEESHLEDFVPGGNSTNGLPGRFTKRLRRG